MRKRVFLLCPVLCLIVAFGSGLEERPVRTADVGAEEQAAPDESSAPEEPEENSVDQYTAVLELLAQYDAGKTVDAAFLSWACENVAPDFATKLADSLAANGWEGEPFHALFGETLHVLRDRYADPPGSAPAVHETGAEDPVTLAFSGDVNLADDWENMLAYRAQPDGVEGVISAPLLERMRGADILLVNNEFCFSDRGAPREGKQYTFRAAMENVQLYHELGVDIVSLANNHVFDYGEQAFQDTLNTLSKADIPYVGAGQDIAEAMRARYFHAGGMKIAYIAAAYTEIFRFTSAATAENSGVLPCFDGGGLLDAVATARACSDWVIVYLHWGTEYAAVAEEEQVSLAHKLVDNGADIVVGAHPHVLQGMEFYAGKPIAYSLGNFWFNTGSVDTALLEIELRAPGQYRLRVQPCTTAGGTVRLLEEDAERRALFQHLEKISEGVLIQDDGTVNPQD